jgi:hypothetical protein
MQFPEHGTIMTKEHPHFAYSYTLVAMLELLLMAKMKLALTLPEAF